MTDNAQPFWESFPNIFPGALLPKDGHRIPWHKYSSSPRSSQSFCISAFGTLININERHDALDRLASSIFHFNDGPTRKWDIHLEFSDRAILNEYSGTPTQVDVLVDAKEVVLTIESKFVADALEGLGCCSQVPKACRGFYGPGSSDINVDTWCLLEQWNGRRSPRLYWTLGRSYFQESVFERQQENDFCPFRGANFQLMRNFLFAAAYSRRYKRKEFGTIVICPKACAKTLQSQVDTFKRTILRPEFEHLVRLFFYEDYIQILSERKEERLRHLASFLKQRINAESGLQISADILEVTD